MDLIYDCELLLQEEGEQEVQVLSGQEEQPADSLQPLVCWEDLFLDSQLVEFIYEPTLDPELPPT